MKKYLVIFLVLISSLLAVAQKTPADYNSSYSSQPEIFRKLNLNQDPRIEKMVSMHITKNLRTQQLHGYRLEIFFSSELNARQKAERTKSDFLRLYPEHNAYMIYVSPDFKVRVGDFRTKNEALELMKQIQRQFPKAFIVPDAIEFPKIF